MHFSVTQTPGAFRAFFLCLNKVFTITSTKFTVCTAASPFLCLMGKHALNYCNLNSFSPF